MKFYHKKNWLTDFFHIILSCHVYNFRKVLHVWRNLFLMMLYSKLPYHIFVDFICWKYTGFATIKHNQKYIPSYKTMGICPEEKLSLSWGLRSTKCQTDLSLRNNIFFFFYVRLSTKRLLFYLFSSLPGTNSCLYLITCVEYLF